MYIVSCRRAFTLEQFVSNRNRYRNYKNPTLNAAFDEISGADLVAAVANKHVCILVHGFNTSEGQALESYWKIASQMRAAGVAGRDGYGLVIGYLWPGFATSAGYFAAVPNANRSAPFLRDFINLLRPVTLSVDVQTHSLGARVALGALRDPQAVFVDNLLMSAPAVDNHLLEPRKRFFPSTHACNRCFVYHSRQDSVLSKAYWVGDLTDGLHNALGRTGPANRTVTRRDTPNVYVVDATAAVGKDHSGYRKTALYFDHWKRVLSGAPLDRYDELA